jgi:hypothetical protein
MTANLSRRSALAALGSVAAAAPAIALPACTGDERLFALERELLAACSRWKKALDAMGQAESQYFDMCPELPERTPPREYLELYRTITVGQLAILAEDHPLKVWDREIDEAHETRMQAYRAEEQRVSAETGVDAARAECDDQGDRAWDIARTIWDTPASSVAGLLVKVRAAELVHPGDTVDEAHDAIAADIRALAERPL